MNAITETKLWEMYINSAKHAFEKGQNDVAEEILKKSMTELGEIVETRKLLLIEAQHALANIYRSEGRYFEADPLYRWSIAMAEATFGPSHVELIPLLEDLSEFYRLQGRTDEENSVRARTVRIKGSGSYGEVVERTGSTVSDIKAKAS